MIDINKQDRFKIPVTFEKQESVQVGDSRFVPVRIKLMHTGKNFNSSVFDKAVVERCLDTLANTPILGYPTMESGQNDFSDHRYVVEKVDGKYVYKYIGKCFGVIPSEHNAHWETYECSDSQIREFLVCDGLLWTKWDEVEEIMLRDETKGQSMELDDSPGSYSGYEIDNTYFFTSFKFFGACILGEPENGYEPAMIDSNISINFSMDSIKSEIQLKMEMYKQYISQQTSGDVLTRDVIKQNQSDNPNDNSVDINKDFSIQEGGNEELNVGQINAILKEFSLKLSDIDFEISDDITEEGFKNQLVEFTEKQKTPVTFSSTYQQKREALSNACDSIIVRDNEGNVVSSTYFYVCDFDDKYVFVEKYVWADSGDGENTYGRFEYSFSDSDKTATLVGEFEPMVIQWLTMDENAKLEASRGTFEALQNEFEQYKKDYSTPNAEVEQLTEFKNQKLDDERETAESTLFAQFDEVLSENDDYKKIKETSKDFTLEDIESQCLILFGKENMKLKTYTVVSSKSNKTKLPAETPKETKADNPYGDIFN